MNWMFIGIGVLIVTTCSLLSFRIKPDHLIFAYLIPLISMTLGISLLAISHLPQLEGMQDLAHLVVGLLVLIIGFTSLIVVYLTLLFIKKRRRRSL
ncbi:MAG: hypothetical protein ACE3JQ_10820 [Paenisporosarcina sp.]